MFGFRAGGYPNIMEHMIEIVVYKLVKAINLGSMQILTGFFTLHASLLFYPLPTRPSRSAHFWPAGQSAQRGGNTFVYPLGDASDAGGQGGGNDHRKRHQGGTAVVVSLHVYDVRCRFNAVPSGHLPSSTQLLGRVDPTQSALRTHPALSKLVPGEKESRRCEAPCVKKEEAVELTWR
jgi:hypothetical protein